MKTNIVRIGNSKGIRLPKFVLEQCHLKDAVEIEVKGNVLTVRPPACAAHRLVGCILQNFSTQR